MNAHRLIHTDGCILRVCNSESQPSLLIKLIILLKGSLGIFLRECYQSAFSWLDPPTAELSSLLFILSAAGMAD